MRGRADPLSKNEHDFVIEALRAGSTRIDGRKPYDFRQITLTFGEETGHVEASIGRTRYVVHSKLPLDAVTDFMIIQQSAVRCVWRDHRTKARSSKRR